MEDTLFGYDIPMPRKDLFIAIATVAAFLPAVVLAYNFGLLLAWLFYRPFANKKQD